MPTLSAFADEIGDDLSVQTRVLIDNGVRHIDLRGVWGCGVLELTPGQRADLRSHIDGEGVRIAAVGSPIGKSTIDKPPSYELERLEVACEIAAQMDATFIRVFSFYAPEGESILDYRAEVLERMAGWVEYVQGSHPSLVLTHENEADIYGDSPDRCLEILDALHGPNFVGCYDPANFAHWGVVDPLHAAWEPLAKYIGYFHLKDYKEGEETAVPCGQGDGEVQRVLRAAHASGYDGFMTLEPHLAKAGQFRGFTGPDLFKVAVDAVRKICDEEGIPLS
jgi:sugar phosphate isomerase/epimerase